MNWNYRDFFIILLVCIKCFLYAQNSETGVAISGIDQLKSIDSTYKIYLTGELHTRNGDDEMQLEQFKYLVKNKNVKILLLECGMGSAYVINKYLETQDKALWYIESYYESDKSFLYKLYLFKKELPPNLQFKVAGIDYEKNTPALSWALRDMFIQSKVWDSLNKFPVSNRVFLEKFISDDNVEFKSRKVTYQNLDSLLVINDRNKLLLSRTMGKHYDEMNRMLENYRLSKRFRGVNFEKENCPFAEQREKMLYDNVIQLAALNPSEKMFGQFGMLHVNLKRQLAWWNKKSGWYSFSAMLNCEPDSPFNGKVCCIEAIYFGIKKKNYKRQLYTLGFLYEDLNNMVTKCNPMSFCLIQIDNKEIYDNKFQFIIVNRW